jgi:hypothetical protein
MGQLDGTCKMDNSRHDPGRPGQQFMPICLRVTVVCAEGVIIAGVTRCGGGDFSSGDDKSPPA